MEQTAVEWFEAHVNRVIDLHKRKFISEDKFRSLLIEYRKQANAMFEEQIKNSYHSGTIDGFNFRTTSISPNPKQYYNETFKKT